MKKRTLSLALSLVMMAALLPVMAVLPASAESAADRMYVALTFDDGPNTAYTAGVLDELDKYGAKGTFYINGKNINDDTTPILQRMVSGGHAVDNHSWHHYSFGDVHPDSPVTYETPGQARDDISKTSQAIFEATGQRPFSFRAPFFQWGDILVGLDAELSLAFIDADVDTSDWRTARTSEQIANTVKNNSEDGDIILMHDGGGDRSRTVESLQHFIPQMQEMGFEFVTVRRLFEIKNVSPETFTGKSMMPKVNRSVPSRRDEWGTPTTPLWPDWPNITAQTAGPLDSASGWAKPHIESAMAKGFVPSDIQNNYQGVITRQEFCRIAVKWAEYKLDKDIGAILTEKGLTRDPDAFTDTKDSYILAAFALGITAGVGNNRFDPDGEFTREQAAVMIRNVCDAVGMDITNTADASFNDIAMASRWAVDAINFVCNSGIMAGTGGTAAALFSPFQTYTREQSITTFNNITTTDVKMSRVPEN